MKKLGLLSCCLLLLCAQQTTHLQNDLFNVTDKNVYQNEEVFTLRNHTAGRRVQKDLTGATKDATIISTSKTQYRLNEDETTTMRFVSAIDYDENSSSYSEVGFNVSYVYNQQTIEYTYTVSTLYKSITADEVVYSKNSGNMNLIFDEAETYDYFVTFSLMNIPYTNFDTEITVQPYVIKEGITYTSLNKKTDTIYRDEILSGAHGESISCSDKIELEDKTKVAYNNVSGGNAIGSSIDHANQYAVVGHMNTAYEGLVYHPSGSGFVRETSAKDQMIITYTPTKSGVANLIISAATNNSYDATNYTIQPMSVSITTNVTSANTEEVTANSTIRLPGKTSTFKDEEAIARTSDSSWQPRYLFLLWNEFNIAQVNLIAGEEYTITLTLGASGHYDYVRFDYDSSMKIEAESDSVTRTKGSNSEDGKSIAVGSDHSNWKDSVSSGGKFVTDMRDGDSMSYKFNAVASGYIQFGVTGSSNVTTESSTSSPNASSDVILNNVLQLRVNDLRVKLSDSLMFGGCKKTDLPSPTTMRVYTNYQNVTLVTLKVEQGKEYKFDIKFLHQNGVTYTDGWGNMSFGWYDYLTIQYVNL